MAKLKTSRHKSSTQGRDTRRIANSYYRTQPELPLGLPKLTPIEDRRTFHPFGETRPARSFLRSHPKLIARTPTPSMLIRSPDLVTPGVAFQAPRDVLVCVRRKRRKEVLHALNHTGKSGQKRPRRNFWSEVSCK